MAKKIHVSKIRYTDLSPKEFAWLGWIDSHYHYTRLFRAPARSKKMEGMFGNRRRDCASDPFRRQDHSFGLLSW